jgi:3-carboxy-cis,cis-muconate cycloisomerase
VVIETIFSPAQRLQYVLAFEASLARALVTAGVAPRGVEVPIAACCDPSRFDLDAIARDAVDAGNDAIPIVERLRAFVAERDTTAASFVHWGATSQDAIDTAFVLQLRDARRLFDAALWQLADTVVGVIDEHADTPIIGRTWLQHATPTTFGLKAAGWLDAIERHRARFAALWERALVIQLGGAVGTLGVLGHAGRNVGDALAADLRLRNPSLPWHTTRDNVAEVATTFGLLVGTLGKIARDVSLLAQSEVDEARELRAPDRGRSSTMPHKQNQVGCAAVMAAAIRAPGLVATVLSAIVQEHERALGGWQAEWDTVPEICILTYEALTRTGAILDGLEVDREKMMANISVTRGRVFAEALTFALAKKVGREAAGVMVKSLLRRAMEGNQELRESALADAQIGAVLTSAEIESVFDVRHHVAAAEAMARRVADGTRRVDEGR